MEGSETIASDTPSISSVAPSPSSIPTPPSRRAARACTKCYAAKTRCIAVHSGSEGDVKCKRCAHFGLSCVPHIPVARKPRTRKLKNNATLGQLDNVVSVPITSQQIPPPQLDVDNSPHIPPSSNHNPPYETTIPDDPPEIRLPTSVNRSTIEHQQSIIQLYSLSDDDLSKTLSVFRTQMMHHLPFIAIDPSITATELRNTKPFLFQTIILATSHQQKIFSRTDLGEEILRYVGEKLILCGEKNLELLQGLLVYIAWGNFMFHSNSQISFLLQLAVTLTLELGLDKAPAKSRDLPQCLVDALTPRAGKPSFHTLQERRAFLGCFYLSAIIFQCFKKPTGLFLLHNSYVEQCCVAIDEANEYPTDQYLTSLVRLQMVRRSGQSLDFDEPNRASNTPLGMSFRIIQRDLNTFRNSIPDNLHHPSLFLHFHSISIDLFETGLYDTNANNKHSFGYLDQLFACLTALTAFFDAWFELPSAIFIDLPFVAWSQLGNAITAMSRILLFKHPDWDLEHARSIVDYPKILEKLGQGMENAIPANFSNTDNVFGRYARRVRWVKGWFEARLVPETAQNELNLWSDQTWSVDYAPLDDMLWQEFFNNPSV